MPSIDLHGTLADLFEAERAVRKLHDTLATAPRAELLELLDNTIAEAADLDDDEEASLRLVRIAEILGEVEGPKAVDLLIDVLGTDFPEARLTAGEELVAIAYERFKEVALGAERALKRLPVGSPALPEIPYLLVEIPEPGVIRLLEKFLKHADPDAVAAAIEVASTALDESLLPALEALRNDKRTVQMGGEEEGDQEEEVSIGDLAAEAIDMINNPDQGDEEEEEEEEAADRRGARR